jgi:N-acetylglucosaminyldiphosphoundecaprenol N-acetyl-beta-D-mannosaminyltransferase
MHFEPVILIRYGEPLRAMPAGVERAQQKMQLVNANGDMMVLAQKRLWIRALFQKADIAFCGSYDVQLTIRALIRAGIHRSTPPDWIGDLMEALNPDAWVFWLGGQADAAIARASRFETLYGVKTDGFDNGFFDVSPGSRHDEVLADKMTVATPAFLLVNTGIPNEEQWLWEHWHWLSTGVAIATGALIDHAAGRVRLPPRWVAHLGIEWLVRLAREPRRRWRRYLSGLPILGFFAKQSRLLENSACVRQIAKLSERCAA